MPEFWDHRHVPACPGISSPSPWACTCIRGAPVYTRARVFWRLEVYVRVSPVTIYLTFLRQGLILCLELTKSGYPRWPAISSDWSISASPRLRLKAWGPTMLAKVLQRKISSLCAHQMLYWLSAEKNQLPVCTANAILAELLSAY